jgi:hypothetical protein
MIELNCFTDIVRLRGYDVTDPNFLFLFFGLRDLNGRSPQLMAKSLGIRTDNLACQLLNRYLGC